jgi:hypothetical protein
MQKILGAIMRILSPLATWILGFELTWVCLQIISY